MSYTSVKTSWNSTYTAYSEMCPIKGPTLPKHRTVEELEKDANCNSSDCK